MNVEQRVIISAGLDPSQFEQGAQRISAAMQQMAASTTQSVSQMSRGLMDGGRGFEQLAKSFSTGYREAQAFAQAVQTAYRTAGEGRDKLGLLPGILDAISQRYGIMGEAARRAALTMVDASASQAQRLAAFQSILPGGSALPAENDRIAVTSRSAQFAIRDMGMQSIDVFQQLASGAPILRTLIQQGGQIAQVNMAMGVSFATLATGVRDALGSALRFILSPLGLLLTSLAALGAAALVVGSRVVELAEQHNQLRLAIEGSGRSVTGLVPGLEAYTAALRRTGVAGTEAAKAAAELARTPGLTGRQLGQVESLAPVIPTIAAAGGDTVLQTQKAIAEALMGHKDSVQKLDDQYRLFSVTELANIDAMIKAKGAGADLQIVIDRLRERFGAMEGPLSAAGEATLSLSNAWQQFIDRIAKSEFAVGIVQRLTNALRDANVSDLTGQLTKLQGEQMRQQREVQDAPGSAAGSLFVGASPRALAQAQLDATNAQLATVEKRIRDMTMPAITVTAPGGSGVRQGTTAFGPGTAADAQALIDKQTFATAQQKAGTSDAVRVKELNAENARNLALLKELGPRTAENAAAEDTLRHAIEANDKALASMNHTKAAAVSASDKQVDTLNSQIRAQLDLADAYRLGDAAVQRVLATQAAEKQLISDGLAKSKNYNDLLAQRTAQFLELAQAQGQAKFAEELQTTQDQLAAQLRINAAYDGTAQSVEHATAVEKVRADLIRNHFIPDTDEFIQKQNEMVAMLDRGAAANREFKIEQNASNELANATETAFNTIGNAITQAFVSGESAAVSFQNVAKAVIAQVIQELIKLSVIAPILNAIFPGSEHRTTASDVFGGLLGGVGAVAGAGEFIDSGTWTGFAKGGVFSGSPSLSAFSNSIISSPTLFDTGLSGFRAYAQGGTGLMGEAGSEAIIPLVRGPDGNLGVRGGGGGGGVSVVVNTPINITGGGGGQQGKPLDPQALKALQQTIDQTVRHAVRSTIIDERRPGGDLYR